MSLGGIGGPSRVPNTNQNEEAPLLVNPTSTGRASTSRASDTDLPSTPPTTTKTLPPKKKFDPGLNPPRLTSTRPDGRIVSGPEPQNIFQQARLSAATRMGATMRKLTGTAGALKDFETTGYHMSTLKEGQMAHTDSHMHPWNYVQRGILLRRLTQAEKDQGELGQLDMMDSIGIRNSVMMPIPTTLASLPGGIQLLNAESFHLETGIDVTEEVFARLKAYTGDAALPHAHGEHDHNCGSLQSYYVPDWALGVVNERLKADAEAAGTEHVPATGLTLDHLKAYPDLRAEIFKTAELYVDTSVNGTLHKMVQDANLNAADRSRLDPMITGLHLGDPRVGDTFLRELYNYKGTFTGIGEITVDKELVKGMFAGSAQANVQERMEGLLDLCEKAGVVGAPIVLHCDVDGLDHQLANDEVPPNPSNLAGLREFFQNDRVQGTKIVWAHAGGLGRFVQERPGTAHITDLKGLLRDCPNLHLDLSWSVVAEQLTKSPEHTAEWAEFLNNEEFHGRICFGSDTLSPRKTETWNQTLDTYNKSGLLDKLTPEARHSLLNGTYDKVFVESRKEVRKFEKEVLTQQFFEQKLLSHGGANGSDPQRITVDDLKAAKKAAYERADGGRTSSIFSRWRGGAGSTGSPTVST